jgi:DNA-directed RNA polymerase specialized sigma24 family protein
MRPDEDVDPHSAPHEQNERDRRLWAAFRQLPPNCQELLRLTVLAGRAEYAAVAEALHMPRGSIGPTRGRCIKKLRELLERDTDHAVEPTMTEPLALFLALGEAIDDADPVPVELVLYPAV